MIELRKFMDERLLGEKWYSSMIHQAPITTVFFLKNNKPIFHNEHVASIGQAQDMIYWYPIYYHQMDVQHYTSNLLFIKVR